MPGKSQPHTDAVLNVLRGTTVNGVSPYVGLFSAAPANDAAAGTELRRFRHRGYPSLSSSPHSLERLRPPWLP